MQLLTKERESKMHREQEDLEAQKLRIMEMKQRAEEEYEQIKLFITRDDEYRLNLHKSETAKADQEQQRAKEKMSMDDAARFIQRKWNWFQTVGKFLAKKKKGRKGGKKGKKK